MQWLEGGGRGWSLTMGLCGFYGLGPPIVPLLPSFFFFLGGGSPTKTHYQRKKVGYPYSNLSTGGPSGGFMAGGFESLAQRLGPVLPKTGGASGASARAPGRGAAEHAGAPRGGAWPEGKECSRLGGDQGVKHVYTYIDVSCVYMFIYTHMYTYIYIYIHIYI